MDRNNIEDLFTETLNTPEDDRFTYIDAFVSLRKDPSTPGEKAGKLNFRQEIVRTFCDTVLQTRLGENVVFDSSLDGNWYFDYQWYRYDPRQSLMVYAICVPFDERRKPLNEKGFKLKAWVHRDYKNKIFSKKLEYPTATRGWLEWDFIMNDHWQTKDDPMELLNMRWVVRGENPFLTPEEQQAQRELPPLPCDPVTDMNRCAFSSRAPSIFQTVMNELVTMRQAAVYGYRYYSTDDKVVFQEAALDMAVEDFAMKYFMDGTDGTVTCNDKDLHFLNAWKIASSTGTNIDGTTNTLVEWDKKHCYHPKTSKLVRDTIKDQRKLLESLYYLNPIEFFKISNKCDEKKSLLTRHWCALSNYQVSPWDNDSQAFHNVLLNELMWYNLFTTYYLNNITTNNSLSKNVWIVAALNSARDEVSILAYEQQLASQAIETTMRMLNNVQATYPIHVWLQAYLEDIKWYRKQLAKVYTPMHQLSYLLRNVQECS